MCCDTKLLAADGSHNCRLGSAPRVSRVRISVNVRCRAPDQTVKKFCVGVGPDYN